MTVDTATVALGAPVRAAPARAALAARLERGRQVAAPARQLLVAQVARLAEPVARLAEPVVRAVVPVARRVAPRALQGPGGRQEPVRHLTPGSR